MDTLVIAWFYALCAVCAGIPILDYLRGKSELLSFRNIFLGGLIWFQFYNAIPVVRFPVAEEYSIPDVIPAATIFAGWGTIFLIMFLISYHSGIISKPAAARVPLPQTEASRTTFIFIAPVVLVTAFFLKTVSIPYLAFLTGSLALSLASLGAGLGAFLWGPRLTNPIAAMFSLFTFGVAAYITGIGEFSRRPLLNAVFGFFAGMYFSRLRYMKPSHALPLLAALGLGGLIVIGLHTIGQRNIAQGLTKLNPEGISTAVGSVTETYGTPRHALWVINAVQIEDRDFDEQIPFLNTIKYIFYLPIPRDLWAGKPYPTSTFTADWSDRQGVKRGRGGVTSPVGIVGNGAVEGGTFAVFVYGIFFGVLIRFFDELFKRSFGFPLILLAIGSTLGQLFAVPRGETPIMTFNFMVGTVSATIIAVLLASLAAKLFPASAVGDLAPIDDDWYDDEDADGYEDTHYGDWHPDEYHPHDDDAYEYDATEYGDSRYDDHQHDDATDRDRRN